MSGSRDEVAALQRALTRMCFDRAAAPDDVAALSQGGSEGVLLYRELVRTRLRELVSVALPKTERVIGRPANDALLAAFLAEAPPRSRYFREVIPAWIAFVSPQLRGPEFPEHAADVLALEGIQWELSWRDGDVEGPIGEIDLERIPVAHPTLRSLSLGHAVHKAEDPPAKGTFFVSVHRRPDHVVETRMLDATGARLVRAWSRGDRTVIDGVRDVLAEEGREADPAFVEKMTALLSALVESGALLGSRT